MLQIAFIRENQEKVINALAKRNMDAKTIVEEVVQLDEKRRATQVELDGVLSESNKLSKDIGELMKGGEKAKAAILKEKTVALKEKSKVKHLSGSVAPLLYSRAVGEPSQCALGSFLYRAYPRERRGRATFPCRRARRA